MSAASIEACRAPGHVDGGGKVKRRVKTLVLRTSQRASGRYPGMPISNTNTLAQNFEIAYADYKVTQGEITAMQQALNTNAVHVGNTYPGVAEFERFEQVTALRSIAASLMKTSVQLMHPAGAASVSCSPGNTNLICSVGQALFNKGFAQLQVANLLSTGFNIAPLSISDFPP